MTLTCAARDGVGPLDFAWTKDGTSLTTSIEPRGGCMVLTGAESSIHLPIRNVDGSIFNCPEPSPRTSTLVIPSSAPADAGEYRCEVIGVEGTNALSAIAVVAVTAAGDATGCRTAKCTADEVKGLPGWEGPLPSRHYSGYVNVASGDGGNNPKDMLHYWLVEAEKVPPADAPLVRPPPPFCAKALGGP